jgi:hypothetical protein
VRSLLDAKQIYATVQPIGRAIWPGAIQAPGKNHTVLVYRRGLRAQALRVYVFSNVWLTLNWNRGAQPGARHDNALLLFIAMLGLLSGMANNDKKSTSQ